MCGVKQSCVDCKAINFKIVRFHWITFLKSTVRSRTVATTCKLGTVYVCDTFVNIVHFCSVVSQQGLFLQSLQTRAEVVNSSIWGFQLSQTCCQSRADCVTGATFYSLWVVGVPTTLFGS